MSRNPLNVAVEDSDAPRVSRPAASRPALFTFLALCAIGAAGIGIGIGIHSASSGVVPTPPGTTARPGTSVAAQPGNWVLAESSLDNLLRADRSITRRTYDRPHVYITGSAWSKDPVPPGWRSVPTVDFRSYAAFSAAVRRGTMPGWARAVLYDPEAWPQTPAHEQTHVAYYMRRFSRLAHRHSWTVIMTPGTDLMNIYPKMPGETNAHAFVRFNIAGAAARYADISATQSQTLELNPMNYRWFLLRTRSQALAANLGDVFLGGLTVTVLGKPASARALYDATAAAGNLVSGFLIYVSRAGPGPANAERYLRALAARPRCVPGARRLAACGARR